MAIYEFNNYKEFIADTLEARSAEGASRKGLANFVGCQPSHISAVLSGDAHLSSEQAEKAARFLGLNKDQTEYFLLLVQSNRAGTKQLQNVYNSMLKQYRERLSLLKSKLGIKDEISDADKAKYYSSWIYPCIHVMLSIKEFQSPKAIAAKLRVETSRIEDVISFLLSAGLAEKIAPSTYRQKCPLLHLDRTSSLIIHHHRNWRLKAIEVIDAHDEDNLHYSGVVSLSSEDVAKVRRVLSDALKNAVDVIRNSKEEEVACLNIDFFSI